MSLQSSESGSVVLQPDAAGATQHVSASQGAATLQFLTQFIHASPQHSLLLRPQLMGGQLFYLCKTLIENERGISGVNLLGVLAALGGYSCVIAALHDAAKRSGGQRKLLGILNGTNGQKYLFGPLPEKYLIADPSSLLAVTLSGAHDLGATVTPEMFAETVLHTMQTSGSGAFGIPRLPLDLSLGVLPITYVKSLWPICHRFLRQDELDVLAYPTAFGFALKQALRQVRKELDPTSATTIVLECAVPMAKIHPTTLLAS